MCERVPLLQRAIVLPVLLSVAGWAGREAAPCTTLMIGRQATQDGSVLMGSSCDGDIMGLIYVMPANDHPEGAKLPMYWNVPRPTNYAEYMANLRKGYERVGTLSVGKTYRSIILAGNIESMTTGGMNEFGLSIAIEFLPMRPGLACAKGVVSPNSNHWTTSLIANGLMRAKTARQAIRLIGSTVEQYGFQYYWAPKAGVALPIADDREVWLMEIFGPGEDWTPSSGKLGGVWCAQRIPDDGVGCSANRSRIGELDLANKDYFMASSNVFSLAEELGYWEKGKPFVWREAYGAPGGRQNSLREWRALSLAAPSLRLKATGDPLADRYPFSVKPDRPLDVDALMTIMRDGYQGTPYDLTQHPAFHPGGKNSPLARPWGPPELFDLLGIRPERAICTPASGYVFLAQLRHWLPDSIGHCMWFAYGPAYTSCFAPVYAGVTDLPDAWDHPANFTRIDRAQAQWNFRFVHNLADNLRYQEAVRDIQNVFRPAEKRFLAIQAGLEREAAGVFQRGGAGAAERFVTDYTGSCLKQVGYAYHELVDYLMFQYLLGDADVAPPAPPAIGAPTIPQPRPLPPPKDFGGGGDSTAESLARNNQMGLGVSAARESAVVSPARQDKNGIIVHTVQSARQSGPTTVRVLLPDNLKEGARYRVLYVLPVEAGDGSRYGDGLLECRKSDLHNKHSLICVAPTFSALPWYADHPADARLQQETYFTKVVVPFVEETYPAVSAPAGRLFVGFSKSGWGAWSLLLRHLGMFSKAAAWDAPLMMDRPDKFGMRPIFGTQENFAEHQISRLLPKQAAQLQGEPRLLLLGYGNFRSHHQQAHALMDKLGVRHVYKDGPERPHDWASGWLPEAVAMLVK